MKYAPEVAVQMLGHAIRHALPRLARESDVTTDNKTAAALRDLYAELRNAHAEIIDHSSAMAFEASTPGEVFKSLAGSYAGNGTTVPSRDEELAHIETEARR